MQFTLATLLYGAYPDLATRVLGSIQYECLEYPGLVQDVRIGMNGTSEASVKVAINFAQSVSKSGIPVSLYTPAWGDQPKLKYPVMRKMLYDTYDKNAGRIFGWLDDDSLLQTDVLNDLYDLFHKKHFSFLGVPYSRPVSRPQQLWVQNQKWATGYTPTASVRFPAGSCWFGLTEFLKRRNYPFPELSHCGGDTTLGHLLAATMRPDSICWDGERYCYHNCNTTQEPSSQPRRGHTESEFASDYVGRPLPFAPLPPAMVISRFVNGSRRDYQTGKE